MKGGFAVVVYDVSREPVAELAKAGAVAATSPADAARKSEVVWLMLHPAQVGEVLRAEDGVLKGASAGTVVVDGGNCDPPVSRRHAEAAADAGVSYLDAGCSGGPHGAKEGGLAIMVGGDEKAYERCLPVFEAVGEQIAYMGPSGNGHLSKVINNMITKMTDFVIAESLTLASKAGLDVATLLDVISGGLHGAGSFPRPGSCFTRRRRTGTSRVSSTLHPLRSMRVSSPGESDSQVSSDCRCRWPALRSSF